MAPTFGTEEVTGQVFLGALELKRVGVYPEKDDTPVLLDYRMGTDEDTNYVLSVAFDSRGHVDYVAMES